MNVTAIIAAGGSGRRLGHRTPKQFLFLRDRPLIVHTLQAFETCDSITSIVVVLPESELGELDTATRQMYKLWKIHGVVPGGATRQASVRRGLQAVPSDTELVAIHDAARCLITPGLIERTIQACQGWDGAIAALPVRDTLKKVEGEGIQTTEPRQSLWAMQTPQVFPYPLIREAYERAAAEQFIATDDAAVAERYGARVRVVEGSTRNMKVTLPEDLILADKLLATEKAT